MGKSGLTDIYTRKLRVHISGKPRVPCWTACYVATNYKYTTIAS